MSMKNMILDGKSYVKIDTAASSDKSKPSKAINSNFAEMIISQYDWLTFRHKTSKFNIICGQYKEIHVQWQTPEGSTRSFPGCIQ